VLDVAVIGVPDARMGEVGVTFVVAKNLAEAEVVDWARERLANYKVPRHVVFVDDLPRNSSMKVLKSTLRKQYETSCA
jgi:acyl-CoA synthetase (AMP-forming)/AMP-acid ligase II